MLLKHNRNKTEHSTQARNQEGKICRLSWKNVLGIIENYWT